MREFFSYNNIVSREQNFKRSLCFMMCICAVCVSSSQEMRFLKLFFTITKTGIQKKDVNIFLQTLETLIKHVGTD